MARKPRSDSKLAALPKLAKDDLELWMVEENRPYDEVKALLASEHGIETSVGALSNYYGRNLAVKKIELARDLIEGLGPKPEEGGHFVERAIGNFQQMLFEGSLKGDMSLKELKVVADIVGAARRDELKLKEIELNIARFRETTKSSVEKGLDALYQDIENSPEAREIFERLKSCVLDRIDGKEVA